MPTKPVKNVKKKVMPKKLTPAQDARVKRMKTLEDMRNGVPLNAKKNVRTYSAVPLGPPIDTTKDIDPAKLKKKK